MTGPDLYSPETTPRERNHRVLTMNEVSKGQTVYGDTLGAILSRLRVSFDADKIPLRITNEFWPNGEPLYLMPDARIHDGRYFDGVFEVDGSVHKTQGGMKWDARKDAYYEMMGLWHERLLNKDVHQGNVEAILARHARKVDEYGGIVP